MLTLNWVFEIQPIVSGILTRQVAENNVLADEKGPWKSAAVSHLYTHLYYRSVRLTNEKARPMVSILLHK